MKNFANDRRIRIFISSTFADMQKERSYIMQNVIPRLRMNAQYRWVSLECVDLRWGITEKEVDNGKVVGICLNEIDNSRPFFIGLLGDRYGWIPTEADAAKDASLALRFPWINECIATHKSITEIEMTYATHTDTPTHASFFLRVPFDPSDGQDGVSIEKLRTTIKNRYKADAFNYHSVEELGTLIETKFTEILDMYFPEVNFTEQQLFAFRQMGLLSQKRGYYYGNPKYDIEIQDFFKTNNRKVLILNGPDKNLIYGIISHFLDLLPDDYQNPAFCLEYNDEEVERFVKPQVGNTKLFIVDNILPQWLLDGDHKVVVVCNHLDNLHLQSIPKTDCTITVKLCFTPEVLRKRYEAFFDHTSEYYCQLPGSNLSVNDMDIMISALDDHYGHAGTAHSFRKAIPKKDFVDSIYGSQGIEVIQIEKFSKEQAVDFLKSYLKQKAKSLDEKIIELVCKSVIGTDYEALRIFADELIQYACYEDIEQYAYNLLKVENLSDFYSNLYERRNIGNDTHIMIFEYLTSNYHPVTEECLKQCLNITQLQWSRFISENLHFISFTQDGVSLSKNVANSLFYRVSQADQYAYKKKTLDWLCEQSNLTFKQHFTACCYSYYLKEWDVLHRFLQSPVTYQLFGYKSIANFWFDTCRFGNKVASIQDIVDMSKQYSSNPYLLMKIARIVERYFDNLPKADLWFRAACAFWKEADDIANLSNDFWECLELYMWNAGSLGATFSHLLHNEKTSSNFLVSCHAIQLLIDVIDKMKNGETLLDNDLELILMKTMRTLCMCDNPNYLTISNFMYAIGTLFLHKKDYDKAEKILTQALFFSHDPYLIHIALGNICQEKGEWLNAIRQYEYWFRSGEMGLGSKARITDIEISKCYFKLKEYKHACMYAYWALESSLSSVTPNSADIAEDYHLLGTRFTWLDNDVAVVFCYAQSAKHYRIADPNGTKWKETFDEALEYMNDKTLTLEAIMNAFGKTSIEELVSDLRQEIRGNNLLIKEEDKIFYDVCRQYKGKELSDIECGSWSLKFTFTHSGDSNISRKYIVERQEEIIDYYANMSV